MRLKIVFVCAGLALLISTLLIAFNFYTSDPLSEARKDANPNRIQMQNGTITKITDTNNKSNHNPIYELTIDFNTQEGQIQSITVQRVIRATELDRFKVGSQIKIQYDSQNPTKAILFEEIND